MITGDRVRIKGEKGRWYVQEVAGSYFYASQIKLKNVIDEQERIFDHGEVVKG